MSTYATAQRRVPAATVTVGDYIYSWPQRRWVPVLSITHTDDEAAYAVTGQDTPIGYQPGDDVDVCTAS